MYDKYIIQIMSMSDRTVSLVKYAVKVSVCVLMLHGQDR